MQKSRFDFEPDEWLSTDLETYQTQHPELDFKKDVLQNYIRSLKEKISTLEAHVQYLTDTAEKSVSVCVATSSLSQDSPILEKGGVGTQQTQEPQVLPPSSGVHTLAIRGKSYRILEDQRERIVWKDGEATFSLKHAEHLAFMQAAAQIAADAERTKTTEHQKRAEITANLHREIAIIRKRGSGARERTGEIIDGGIHGGLVEEYIR